MTTEQQTSFITKYRPDSFDKVVGQDAVVKALAAAIEKKSSKTFLIDGPSGCGKTTLARIAAVAAGCNPQDIREIDASTHTGIDDMREIASGLMYRPIGGEVKALIVDEAHGLSKNAWNSLLKILEEPPSHVYWFLCTTEAQRVPQTIMTRCTRLQLKEVPVKTLTKLLFHVADEEKILPGGDGDDVIRLCAAEAGGSPRQALANLALCMTARDRSEASDLMASSVESHDAIDLAKALLNGTDWASARKLLIGLKEVNGESVRQTVRAYITAVILGEKTSEKTSVRCLAILDKFSEPCAPGDKISPVVLMVGRLLLDG